VATAPSAADALRQVASGRVAVLACGGRLAGEEARRLLAGLTEIAEAQGLRLPIAVVLAAGPTPSIFDRLVEDEHVFYLSQRPPAVEEAAAILATALCHSRERHGEGPLQVCR